MTVAIKRVYEPAKRGDGVRVLVDRLWPRGLTKERAAVHEWLRDLSPSDELRKWFHARPELWQSFRKKYLKELLDGMRKPPTGTGPGSAYATGRRRAAVRGK